MKKLRDELAKMLTVSLIKPKKKEMKISRLGKLRLRHAALFGSSNVNQMGGAEENSLAKTYPALLPILISIE